MGVVAMLGVQALAVLISTSLNTWFALSIALWLMVRWRKSIKIGIILLGISAIILLVLRTGGISPNGSHGFESAINISIKNRIDIWKNGFEIAKTHPVLGIGMDQLRRTPKMLYEYSHAHNQFLHTAAELGIPGLVAYLAILFGIYRMTKEVKRSILPEWIRMTSRGLGTGVFAFTLFGMVDTIPLGAKIGIFFWISIAMITCIYLYGRSTGLSATSGGRGNG
jgi:putative inorganic carbon (HCO3(-)) transporter